MASPGKAALDQAVAGVAVDDLDAGGAVAGLQRVAEGIEAVEVDQRRIGQAAQGVGLQQVGQGAGHRQGTRHGNRREGRGQAGQEVAQGLVEGEAVAEGEGAEDVFGDRGETRPGAGGEGQAVGEAGLAGRSLALDAVAVEEHDGAAGAGPGCPGGDGSLGGLSGASPVERHDSLRCFGASKARGRDGGQMRPPDHRRWLAHGGRCYQHPGGHGPARQEDDMTQEGGEDRGAEAIDFMATLERVLAAKPYATPADVRAMAPELRDWADKRLAKNIVLTRLRLAARGVG